MSLTRRAVLRAAGAAAVWLLGAPGAARARERALAIHRATRNTLTGAVGVALRRVLRGPLPRAKAYPDRPRIALPATGAPKGGTLAEAVAAAAPSAGFAPAFLSAAELARLLRAANGVTERRDDVALRAAPSAGALYAGELYVVAERVDGLAPGVYYFDPLRDDLVALRPGPALARVAEALEAPAGADGAAAAVLLSNVFARYRYRYANRGYRYALIDSGHIGENLRLAAASAGLAERAPTRFRDDALNELIGLDGVDEAVCALHLVGARGEGPPESAGAARPLVERAATGAALPAGVDDAPERYHEATKLVPAPEGVAPSEAAPLPVRTVRGEALPEPAAPPPLALEAAIRQRRSALRFAPTSVERRDLAWALRLAAGTPALRRASGVELWIAAQRVAGVAAGLYRVAPDGASLALEREGELGEALTEACLGQQLADRAAVAVLMVGRVEAAAEAGGERSYRDLLLECGAIGQRLYLAAESQGLAARNLAAFVDHSLNGLLGLDGRREAVLHLTLYGPGD